MHRVGATWLINNNLLHANVTKNEIQIKLNKEKEKTDKIKNSKLGKQPKLNINKINFE